jgi:hypothetical protein
MVWGEELEVRAPVVDLFEEKDDIVVRPSFPAWAKTTSK